MRIKIIIGAKITDRNLTELLKKYFKRLEVYHDIELIDFKSSGVESKDINKYKQFSRDCYLVGLDVEGKTMDSVTFAKKYLDNTFKDIAFLIGGADGLPNDLKKECNELFSLSKLTFCHEHALLVLAEQIYRGVMINKGHPYHK